MKKGIGAGTLVVIGLIAWWLTRSKQVQAAGLLPGQTYPAEYGESEYEKLHKTVPITQWVEKELIVYGKQGWEWELQAEIAGGEVPPVPAMDLITTAAWYWDGSKWSTRTRPGFEGVEFLGFPG